MKTRSFTVMVRQEDDTYIAECPEVGTVDQDETIEQAIAGVNESTRLHLEEFPLPETSPINSRKLLVFKLEAIAE